MTGLTPGPAHRLTPEAARRIAVRAQLLALPRPKDLLGMLRHLGVVQADLTAAVAPSPHLVAWSRLGSAYRPSDLDDLLDAGRLIELGGFIRPAQDVALFLAEMQRWPGPEPLKNWQVLRREWVAANDAARRDVLRALRSDGPLPPSALPDTCDVPWRSSGWNDDRNRLILLGFMVARGELAVAGREGREPLYDLAERVYPDLPAVPADEARAILDERRLAALGIARAKAPASPSEPDDVGAAGEPAVVEGVRGTWRIDPRYLDPDALTGPFAGRTVLLSPLDRLVKDRRRMVELFAFDYQLEMYKPAARRRWGTSRCPCCTGTGWSARSTRPPTTPEGYCGSTRSTRTRSSAAPRSRRSTGSWRTSRTGWASTSRRPEELGPGGD